MNGLEKGGLSAIYIGLFLSAATTLIYEVVATNILLFYFSKSTYSVSTVLSVFLFGLGVGSFLYYKYRNKIVDKRLLFGILQIVIALYGFFILTNIPAIVSSLHELGVFVVSALILLFPTIWLGMIFPLSVDILEKKKQGSVGFIYYIDLMGAVAGSLISGFVLIPEFGNTITIYVAVLLSLVGGFVVLKKNGQILITILFAMLLIPMLFTNNNISEITFFKPSPYGEVRVKNNALYVDDRIECFFKNSNTGTVTLETTSKQKDASERRIVTDSLSVFNSKDLDVLNVGLGCGLTLEKIIQEVSTVVDVVEINPVVVEANRTETDILMHERVNLIIADGVSYLRDTSKKYDSIIIDIEEPAVVHASDIYTVESFRNVYDSLSGNGVFGLWTPPCKEGGYYDVLFTTLKEVFPYVYQIDTDISIASKQKLNFEPYVFTERTEINTIDKKPLSKIYLNHCAKNFDSSNFLNFE
jgi:predicted membrane-bound spermidine synthase